MYKKETSRRRRIMTAVAVLCGAIAISGTTAAIALPPSVDASNRVIEGSAATGIHVFETKLVGQSISLGGATKPTTVATKSVPAGKYLVDAMIAVNVQPGSFIVCAVSNTLNGNDGVFGTYQNEASSVANVDVAENEVVAVAAGQSIQLTCDDNADKLGNLVGEAVIDATKVKTLS
jgi:hypothetical protein